MKYIHLTVITFLISSFTMAQGFDFERDTAAIERQLSQDIDQNPTTWGMNDAAEKATKSYDKLLNKYYQACLSKMKAADKPVLIAAQRAWIAYRDKEIKLMEVTVKEEYTGGGSMWSNLLYGNILELTKSRVVDLYNRYLVLTGVPF